MRLNFIHFTAFLVTGMLTFGAPGSQAQEIIQNVPSPYPVYRLEPYYFPLKTNVCSFIQYQKENPIKYSVYECDENNNKNLLETIEIRMNSEGYIDEIFVYDPSDNDYHNYVYKFNENKVPYDIMTGYSSEKDNIFYDNNLKLTYDDISRDFIVKKEQYTNSDKYYPNWWLSNSSKTVIERDSQGRITKVAEYVAPNLQHDFENTFEYGVSDAPEKVTIKSYYNGEPQSYDVYDDIKWTKYENIPFACLDFINIVLEGKDSRCLPKSYNYKTVWVGADPWERYKRYFEYDDNYNIILDESKSYDNYGNIVSFKSQKREIFPNHGYTATVTQGGDINYDCTFSDDEVYVSQYNEMFYDENNILTSAKYIKKSQTGDTLVMETEVNEIEYDIKGRVYSMYNTCKNQSGNSRAKLYISFEYADPAPSGIESVSDEHLILKVIGSDVTFTPSDGSYNVTDIQGQNVMNGSTLNGSISLHNLPSGLYIVNVETELGKQTIKVVI